MKILILGPNQITRWNPGHQQFRNAMGNNTKWNITGKDMRFSRNLKR
jgi:hypothetical protein